MSRLARLRTIRAVQLNHGLRRLAEAARRCDHFADMQARLATLRDEVPDAPGTGAWKAATTCRDRLTDAGRQLTAASADARQVRDAAAVAAGELRVRVDVVDQALAR